VAEHGDTTPTSAGETKVAGISAVAAMLIILMILFFLGFLTSGDDESNEGGGAAPCSGASLALPVPGADAPVVGGVLGAVVDFVLPDARPAELCVNTVTDGNGSGSSQPRKVTPTDGWSVGAGSEQSVPETHDAAANGLPVGDGGGGAGNSLNPQAPSTRPTQPAHEPGPTPAPAPPPPPPPCDPHDPSSPCYEPPCDPSDPDSPCYVPPPYHPGDECDPSSPYYDEHAICL